LLNKITDPDIHQDAARMPKQLMQQKSATQQELNSSTTVGNTNDLSSKNKKASNAAECSE
jgi:hypothetical protein